MLVLITSQKSKSSYEHTTDGGRSSRGAAGAAGAVFSDTVSRRLLTPTRHGRYTLCPSFACPADMR